MAGLVQGQWPELVELRLCRSTRCWTERPLLISCGKLAKHVLCKAGLHAVEVWKLELDVTKEWENLSRLSLQSDGMGVLLMSELAQMPMSCIRSLDMASNDWAQMQWQPWC